VLPEIFESTINTEELGASIPFPGPVTDKQGTTACWAPSNRIVTSTVAVARQPFSSSPSMVNGEDVNLEQVEDGMAWHYKKYQGEQSMPDRISYSDA
jgi:hypothetical protein